MAAQAGIDIEFIGDGTIAYVAGCQGGVVCVVDTTSNEVIETIAVPEATLLTSTPGAPLVYVSSSAAPFHQSTVSAIDTRTEAVIATLPAPGAFAIDAGPLREDGSSPIYVSYLAEDFSSRGIAVIDSMTNEFERIIELPSKPTEVVVSPDGSLLYASHVAATPNGRIEAVYAVDLVRNELIGVISAIVNPFGMAFSADGRRVYVASSKIDNFLAVVDADTAQVMDQIPLPSTHNIYAVALSDDDRRAFVAPYFGAGRIFAIDLETATVDGSFSGQVPEVLLAIDLELSPDGRSLYFPFLGDSLSEPSPTPDPDAPTCGTAESIASLPYFDGVDTRSFSTTTEANVSCGNGSGRRAMWYAYTATASGTITAETSGSDYDTILSVYSGSCGALAEVACNDDHGTLQSEVAFAAQAGTTYYFLVTSYGNSGGTLGFFASPNP